MFNNEHQDLFELCKADTQEGTMENLEMAESIVADPNIRQDVSFLIGELTEDPWLGIR